YDLGPEVGGDPTQNVMGGEGDRFMEFWNLVFMQYFEDGSGEKKPLPNPSIDTGMGLERLTTILQGEISNYHTDLFQDIIAVGSQISGTPYVKDLRGFKEDQHKNLEKSNVALRVLADHSRAASFLIADGVLPSNEGRGYVLRRILRRAIRYGRNLSTTESLLAPMVEAVIAKMSGFYPELQAQSRLILSSVRDEEERFLQTLDQGTSILRDQISNLKKKNHSRIDGDVIFKLYDTFGFPVDLTRLMALEEGMTLDETGFEKKMSEARAKAKASWKGKGLGADQAHLLQWTQKNSQNHPESFTGYHQTFENEAQLVSLSSGKAEVKELKSGEEGFLIFDKTCFYAESGGQVGDTGTVKSATGEAEIFDCTKMNDVHVHHVRVTDGALKQKDPCSLQVEDSERRSTARNHSATHLLHSALRKVLGSHVQQAGSLVEPQRLRFDFTHNKGVTLEEISQIEHFVNKEIAHAHDVAVESMSPKAATEKGALALFGEKYGDIVRVITMGPKSMELCGGTHVKNTSDIMMFKIVSEGGVSSGIRRIEALTGEGALQYFLKHTRENLEVRAQASLPVQWNAFLEDPQAPVEALNQLRDQIKVKEREIQSLKSESLSVEDLMKASIPFNIGGEHGQLILADVAVDDRKVLSELADKLKSKLSSGVAIIVGQGDQSHPLIVSVSKNLTSKINAGQVLKTLAESMGGKGGGRPDFAQGAAPRRDGMNDGFSKVKNLVGI
ncbi:MAG: alanine--tRNA ligase, partial [Bdellovibrionales bacterium]|nr:alanine--tRNA ligase [Bdellovibrionales bacterium]